MKFTNEIEIDESNSPFKGRETNSLREYYYKVSDGIGYIDDLIALLDPKIDAKEIKVLKEVKNAFDKSKIGKWL
jgi:hypothetical protein